MEETQRHAPKARYQLEGGDEQERHGDEVVGGPRSSHCTNVFSASAISSSASRFTRRDILESIIEPSKVVSDQFANTIIKTKNGETIDGHIMEDTPDNLVVFKDLCTNEAAMAPANSQAQAPVQAP